MNPKTGLSMLINKGFVFTMASFEFSMTISHTISDISNIMLHHLRYMSDITGFVLMISNRNCNLLGVFKWKDRARNQ